MQLDPLQPPRRSINLATPDFLDSIGTAVGGRSIGQNGVGLAGFAVENGFMVAGKANNNAVMLTHYADTGSLQQTVTYSFPNWVSIGPGSASVDSNGQILIAGSRQSLGIGGNDFFVLRYNQAGQLDQTFGVGGIAITDFGVESYGNGIFVEPGGGFFQVGSASQKFAIAHYLANGVLDSAFGTAGKVTTAFFDRSAAAVGATQQPDGKLVVAGWAVNSVGQGIFALARYDSRGNLDNSFGTGGKVTTDFGSEAFGGAGLAAVTLQADGKILTVGWSGEAILLARYNPDGTLDASFGGDGKVSVHFDNSVGAVAMAVQPDGKIVTVGTMVSHYGSDFALARFNTDGSLDTSFDTDGRLTTDFGGNDRGLAVFLQPDGKIVAVGATQDGAKVALARYNVDGSLDPSFNGQAPSLNIVGDSGRNTLAGGPGDDRVDGGGGIDSYTLQGMRYQYAITLSADGSRTVADSIQARDGNDHLVSVERLKFSDKSVAFDLDGNAGTVAKVLGAVFGSSAVSNKLMVGIGLSYADSGLSYMDLVSLALNAAGATTHASVVSTLWRNLFGTEPTAVDAAPFVDLLDSGAYTAAALGVLAAEQHLNKLNINLVGLQHSGLDYI